MTRDELYDLHDKLCWKALELMKSKNLDYASSGDPFRNFRMFGELGVLVRMSDKLARLRSILENGKVAVKSESIHDTVLDIINYAVIYEGLTNEQRNDVSANPNQAKPLAMEYVPYVAKKSSVLPGRRIDDTTTAHPGPDGFSAPEPEYP